MSPRVGCELWPCSRLPFTRLLVAVAPTPSISCSRLQREDAQDCQNRSGSVERQTPGYRALEESIQRAIVVRVGRQSRCLFFYSRSCATPRSHPSPLPVPILIVTVSGPGAFHSVLSASMELTDNLTLEFGRLFVPMARAADTVKATKSAAKKR